MKIVSQVERFFKMRVKGAKNKVTIEMERLIATGMNPIMAKIQARENLGKSTTKVSTKATPAVKKVRKVRVTKDKPVKIVKQKKVTKKDAIYPKGIVGYNATTKSAWLKVQNGNSRKHAIRAMCLLCLGGSAKDVKDCTMPSCPLFKFRITG